MDLWSFYFFAKLALHAGQYIDFHLLPNLAFALYLSVPLSTRRLRVTRGLAALPLAAMLLYHDSWLPPVSRILEQGDQLAAFDAGYLVELLGRFVNLEVVVMLAGGFLVYLVMATRLRMRTWAVLSMFAVATVGWIGNRTAPPVQTAAADGTPVAVALDDASLDRSLAEFHAAERARRIAFPAVAANSTAYDLLFLQICSLSWDDLDAAGLRDAPQLKKLDLLLTRFNSAASYSGPAAIRLLRAPCGQRAHTELYDPAAVGCQLFEALEQSGFSLAWLMNHDGRFGNFTGDIRNHGGLRVPAIHYPDLPTVQRVFDGSAVQSDYAVLSRWWQQRLTDPAPRIALYYNSTSLHDGNILTDTGVLPAQRSYEVRAARLLSDLSKFIDLVESSNRRAVIVLVPEHGANLRGDRMQISGLREIPTPAITIGPAGLVIAGPGRRHTRPVRVDQPTSLLAVADAIARLLPQDPYGEVPEAHEMLATIARQLPPTRFVAENEGNVVMEAGGRPMLREPGGGWQPYIDRPGGGDAAQ